MADVKSDLVSWAGAERLSGAKILTEFEGEADFVSDSVSDPLVDVNYLSKIF